MIGIDLFSGAGGMALGASQAGIDVRLAIEADLHAVATYTHNHPNTKVLTGDIRAIKEVKVENGNKGTILFGGPPCQGFSTSNQRTRNSNNPCNWLFLEFIRIIMLLKPDWVVFENVKGIIDTEKGVFLDRINEQLLSCGYTTSQWILNAMDFGAPQKRYRLFIVGSLHGIKLNEPKPTVQKHVTVKQAIFDLPDLPNGASKSLMPYKSQPQSEYARIMRGGLQKSPNHLVTKSTLQTIKRYKYIPQGGNWKDIPAKLMKNYADRSRCHTGIYHRLREDEPSVVIGNYRKNMLVHPTKNRGLSVREAARLQSFPDWYEFKGSIGFQQQQVGNAVPPLLSKEIFNSILRHNI